MSGRLAFVGAGAVGGYVGGHLARAGEDVTLIDSWPEHIARIKSEGLRLSGTQGDHTVEVAALHLHEVQGLFRTPVDIAFVCTKSYDTGWATMLIQQYLAPGGFVVSMQNSINEERIAGIVGWGKTVGCIVSGIGVNAVEPGHVIRGVESGGPAHNVFRVGEVHGRITPRVQGLAEMLGAVDSAAVTTNLWGERWTKLTINSMSNGISAATGLESRTLTENETVRRLTIRLTGEAVRVGQALGYELESIRRLAPEQWVAAEGGDGAALELIESAMTASRKATPAEVRPSTGQDIVKGRRTEIEYLNGLVAAKGEEVCVPAPTHAALTQLVLRVERGDLRPDPANIEGL
jgi:2-dehydropantoate 2-reductase